MGHQNYESPHTPLKLSARHSLNLVRRRQRDVTPMKSEKLQKSDPSSSSPVNFEAR